MSFVDDYRIYTQGNECSPLFHDWAALSTLSSVASRKIFFDQKYFKIYANLYVVFVGEPGDKKTTAMSLARDMCQKLSVPIAPPSITKEAITELMGQKNDNSPCKVVAKIGGKLVEISHLSFYASEIVTMLKAGGAPENMVDFFTDIYDREVFEVKTKNKGTDLIESPYITILACMTPEQTGQLLKQSIITGGLSRRCIFVYGRSKPEPRAFPKLEEFQREAYAKCLKHLERVKAFSAEYTITDDARDYYTQWYDNTFYEMAKPHQAVYKNWLRSKGMLVFKVAMLLDVSQDLTGVINVPLLEEAIRMLDSTEKDLYRIFAGAGKNSQAETASKILTLLEEAPKQQLSKKHILAGCYNDATVNDIDQALAYLVATGEIKRLIDPRTGQETLIKCQA